MAAYSDPWIPGGLAVLGLLALVLGWKSLRKRRGGKAPTAALLALCSGVALEGAAVATAVMSGLVPWAGTPAPAHLNSETMRAKYLGGFVGTRAPDFTLPALSDGHPVHLADHWSRRPLVLVFGSFG